MSKKLVDQEQSDYFGLGELTPEQQERAEAARQTEASFALSGYHSLREEGGYAFELQKQWILGEITTDERIALLDKHERERWVDE